MKVGAVVVKSLLIIINLIYIILGLLVIGGGFVICVKAGDNRSLHALGPVVIFIGVLNILVACIGFFGAIKEKSSVLKLYTGIVVAGLIVKTASLALLYATDKMEQLPHGTLTGSLIEYVVEILIIVCSIYLIVCIKRYRNDTYSQFSME